MGPQESLARLREAEALVQRLGDDQTLADEDRRRMARIHLWIGHAHAHANRGREAIAYMRKVLEAAQALDDEDLLAVPAAIIGRSLALQGQFARAEDLLRQALPPLTKVANWPEWILAQVFLALSLATQGRVGDASAHLDRALARTQELEYATGKSQCHVTFANVCGMCRDGEGMRRHAQAALDVARAAGDRLIIYISGSFLAWAEGRLGDHARAATSWGAAEQAGRRIGGSLVYADWFAAARAELALETGRLEEARTLAERAVAQAQEISGMFAQGLAQRTWAQSLVGLDPGNTVEADAHMAESLRVLEGGNALLEAAHTHMAWALSLHARGAPQAAREHMTRAIAQFETSGLMLLAEHARGLGIS